jgi:hypothetical protein
VQGGRIDEGFETGQLDGGKAHAAVVSGNVADCAATLHSN